MKRSIAVVALLLALTGCASYEARREKKIARETYQDTFYLKYLDQNSALDREIMARVVELRENQRSPVLHNELGALLFQRRFIGDSEKEFLKAVKIDKNFYQGWYNLGLVQIAQGNTHAARRSLEKTVKIMPGHSEALFRLGLLYEQASRDDAAVECYAKAFRINPSLFDPKKNPLIVDTKLTSEALLVAYERAHATRTSRFLPPPAGYQPPPDKKALERAEKEKAAKENAVLLAPAVPAAPATPVQAPPAPTTPPPPPPAPVPPKS